MNKKDLKIEYIKGNKHAGGQHRNSTNSAVRITHIPTGLTAYADERSQHHSKKLAMADLKQKLDALKEEKRAAARKSKRDKAIKDRTVVRTYDYKSGTVKDHRNGKRASIKDILDKGKIDLLR